MKRSIAALAASLLLSTPLLAHHDGETVEKSGIRVSHAHTHEAAATAHGIHVYLTIENTGDTPDRLVSAAVPFANAGRFEANVLAADGTLGIQAVPAIAVEPGQTLVLQPGSIRVVFDNVQKPVTAGSHFDMTLVFENAGPLEMVVEVEHADHDHDADHHHHDDDAGS